MSDKKTMKTVTYAEAGVDIDAGKALVRAIKPLVAKTARPGSNPDLGGFGGLFDLKAAGFQDPVLVAANDGVGTKLKIAIETGLHDHVGVDLVAMCANDLIVQGAEPLFFLDYFATGKLDPDQAHDVIAGIVTGCKQAEIALIGGETAEMPGLYQGSDYDLAGFCVGAVERGHVLPRPDIAQGDHLIALSSSGIHSNGFSLVRQLVQQNAFNWQDKAPFDPTQTLGEALLRPTRIYVKSILSALGNTDAIKGLAHITGGGLTENIPRILPNHLCAKIALDQIQLPPVFRWLKELGELPESDFLRTFNCGVGLVVVVDKTATECILSLLKNDGENAFLIGDIQERAEHPIIYQGQLG